MSGGGQHDDDWSTDAQSLFRASRFDHEASAADKARVQQALALRLAKHAAENASAGEGIAELARRASPWFRSSGALRLVLGALCTAAVSTLSLLAMERPKEQPPIGAAASVPTPAGTTTAPASPASPLPQVVAPAAAARGRAAPRASAPRALVDVEPRGRSRSRSLAPRAADGMHAASDTTTRAQVGPAPESATPPDHADELPSTAPSAVPPSRPSTRPAALPDETLERPGPAPDARAELGLVERMQAAFLAREYSSVLDLCNEHERRWPGGTFVEEREGIRVLVACATHAENADARARTFLRAHPRTPLAHRVAAACGAPWSSAKSAAELETR